MRKHTLSQFVQTAPSFFYMVAGLDFAKNLMPLLQFAVSGESRTIDMGSGLTLQFVMILLSALVYAANWIAYGVFAAILLAIHQEVRAKRAQPNVENGEAAE
jgi:hypothetical protein